MLGLQMDVPLLLVDEEGHILGMVDDVDELLGIEARVDGAEALARGSQRSSTS